MDKRTVRDVLLRVLSLERSYKPKALVASPSWRFRDFLGLAVAYRLVESSQFSFVQVGAFDGVADDALHEVVERYRIRGIVVEPQQRAFEKLRQNYADHPQVTLVNAAISSFDGVRDFYSVRNALSPLASFDRSHLLRNRVPPREIVAQKVRCHTLDGLLDECGLDRVDLVQIDTEGHDYEIIKTIDFDRMRPSIIRFEHVHLSCRDCDECVRMLAAHGYRFIPEKRDLIAILESG